MKLASNITQTYTSVHPTGDGFHLRLLTTAVGIATQERIIMRPPDPRFSSYGNVRIFANMIQVKYPAKHPAHLVGIKRGVVGLEFSGKKRKRMIDKFNQWRMPMRNMVFVHLTYPDEYDQDWHTWKLHLKTFKYHLQRRFPNAQGMWKLELQRRGAPHYHMVIDLGQNCSIRRFRQWLDGVWARIAHDLDQYGGRYACRAEIVTSKRHALNYAAKYCGKVTYAPVDENGEEITSCGMRETIGRQWGVLGKPDFSHSEEMRVLREESTYIRMHAALEMAGRGAYGWRSITKRTWQGSFSVYGIGDDTEYTTRQANMLIPNWEKRYYDSDDPWREIWEIEQRLWGSV